MSHGKAAQRDIVQFVPFRKFKTVRLYFINFVLETESQDTIIKSIIIFVLGCNHDIDCDCKLRNLEEQNVAKTN